MVLTGIALAGLLHRPQKGNGGVLVLSHCFTCSKDYKLMAWLARHLSEWGWVVLRFDFRGLGHSEGDFATSTLSDDVADLRVRLPLAPRTIAATCGPDWPLHGRRDRDPGGSWCRDCGIRRGHRHSWRRLAHCQNPATGAPTGNRTLGCRPGAGRRAPPSDQPGSLCMISSSTRSSQR